MKAPDWLNRHAEEFRAMTGIDVEVAPENPKIFVVLKKAQLPMGLFQVERSDVLFITDGQYPLSAMDMFWTETGVVRPDGSTPQNAEAIEQYLGRSWRRFSWHRNNIWSSAGNPLLDHYAFVESRWVMERRR
jgi:hypothetical protein